MSDVTRILSQIESGDPSAAEQLLPLVYDELRKLAAAKLAQEKPGQTLQATALVHEAYIRLVDGEKAQHWDSRGHFFAAAAEAMRRILVENARRKQSRQAWRQVERVELDADQIVGAQPQHDLLALDEALDALAEHDARKRRAGQAALFRRPDDPAKPPKSLGISRSQLPTQHWAYAKCVAACSTLLTDIDPARSAENFRKSRDFLVGEIVVRFRTDYWRRQIRRAEEGEPMP